MYCFFISCKTPLATCEKAVKAQLDDFADGYDWVLADVECPVEGDGYRVRVGYDPGVVVIVDLLPVGEGSEDKPVKLYCEMSLLNSRICWHYLSTYDTFNHFNALFYELSKFILFRSICTG